MTNEILHNNAEEAANTKNGQLASSPVTPTHEDTGRIQGLSSAAEQKTEAEAQQGTTESAAQQHAEAKVQQEAAEEEVRIKTERDTKDSEGSPDETEGSVVGDQ